MRYIDPSFTEIKESDPLGRIALAAHNCYQVEKNDDPAAFVAKLAGFKHLAMFEHATFAAEITKEMYDQAHEVYDRFLVLAAASGKYYLSFSLRPLLENVKAEDPNRAFYLSLAAFLPAQVLGLFPELAGGKKAKGRLLSREEISQLPYQARIKVQAVTLRIVTDRGVTHELVRHRVASYAQESTRYCNYAKDKFGNELTFIKPLDYASYQALYDKSFKEAEDNYFALLKAGSTPEMARAVLPNKLKATIFITAYLDEYAKIFALRNSPRAHPDMRQVMGPIQDYFYAEGYLKHGEQ